MYARMTVAQANEGRFDEAVRVVRDAFAPAAREQDGFAGFLLLTDRARQELVGISLWETEADLRASGGTGGYYQQELANFVNLLTGPPRTSVHEVIVREP